MISGAKLYDLTEKQVKTYNDCLSKTIRNVPSVSCYKGDCEMYPGTENLITIVLQKLEDNNMDNITYTQWMVSVRSTLETTVQSCSDFLKSFAEKLNILICHSFIARQQSRFNKELKLKLKTVQIDVICDFLKTTPSSHKMKLQGFCWNNALETLHPFVA
jgi:hypothetical protein